MRDVPVVVTRSRVIAAPPERMWSLLSSAQAWSLRPASSAFDITGPDGTRLRVMLGLGRPGPTFLVYEICDDVPGQVMSALAGGTRQPRGDRLTLSVTAHGPGTRASIQVTVPYPPTSQKSYVRAYWERQLEIWLGNLSAVLAGRTPRPAAGITPGLRAACTPRPLTRPVEVSAAAVVLAPARHVWQAVHAPESALLMDPAHVICAGQVPGTPTMQVGEMQYFVRRDDGGRLSASGIVVTELTGEHTALTSSVAARPAEVLHQLTPAEHGTRLQLTYRWAADTARAKALKPAFASAAQATVDGFKNLIENTSDR